MSVLGPSPATGAARGLVEQLVPAQAVAVDAYLERHPWPSFVDFHYLIFPEKPGSDDSTLKELTAPAGGSKKTRKK